jgi:D-psicose/D-tagatose/L-ribulose 3-epimerase
MFTFGVITLIWTEQFTKKDLPLIPKAKELGFDVLEINISHPETFPTALVKEKVKEAGIDVITSTALSCAANLIEPDLKVRENGVNILKKLIDISAEIGSKMLGGVNYTGWGYLTGRPRTEEEWMWSVDAMREVSQYAKEKSDLLIAVEPVNRFETHFLNIAEDAVRYCKAVGMDNMRVHLDSFHMIREETSFTGAVEACGKEYLGYVHACENNRGIPGTGLVPWKEFFTALRKVDFSGPLVIESFDPSFQELNRLCAIWRKFADSGEELAVQGLKNLKNIEQSIAL